MMLWTPIKAKKSLVSPEEKASILAAIASDPTKNAKFWGQQFKRLPATIVKFATEAGLKLAR